MNTLDKIVEQIPQSRCCTRVLVGNTDYANNMVQDALARVLQISLVFRRHCKNSPASGRN